jgi:hypothetical protein
MTNEGKAKYRGSFGCAQDRLFATLRMTSKNGNDKQRRMRCEENEVEREIELNGCKRTWISKCLTAKLFLPA